MISQHTVTLLLADDHPLMRKGLKEVIEEDGRYTIVAEAGDGEKALELIERHQPSIAIVDIDMPRLGGLELAKTVLSKRIPVDIIILTMHDKQNVFNRAMDLGVMGYVVKDSALTDILDAITLVGSGRHYISPSLSGLLLKRSRSGEAADYPTLISLLTPTERKILRLIAEEKTTKEIADHLFVSVRTIDTHRAHICSKLDLHGPTALLRFALENKTKF
ncbi:MAG: response regulator transcription factor [Ignavibacteriales bacterium]|nr:response regulator transcription factor [Ignavibacteriales bacterium]